MNARNLEVNNRLTRIREALQIKAQDGLLGMTAAQARAPEYMLWDWCQDSAKVPDHYIVDDLESVLGLGPKTSDMFNSDSDFG